MTVMSSLGMRRLLYSCSGDTGTAPRGPHTRKEDGAKTLLPTVREEQREAFQSALSFSTRHGQCSAPSLTSPQSVVITRASR
ncbi:hypothetical protein E2C01_036805 [Portunus trituberculatus]|uniref:Uncharacterized protein n=1 Tax=Portunus trituberculatus TaxID=210409 RepID=A0A5B7FC80_PORTR|nr:hypothetical protein [Portunus trituberculatus]